MTHICTSIDNAWITLLDAAMKQPSIEGRSGPYREIVGTHTVLEGANVNFLLNSRRALSPIYASAELLWYLSRSGKVEMLLPYAPQYAKYASDRGDCYGAYGARLADNLYLTTDGMREDDLLEEAINLLRQRPSAKQCVISMWRPIDLQAAMTDQKDIPCTLTWHFLLRDNKLHMIVNMRSNDLWLGYLYDCYVNSTIQKMVAAELGVQPGEYHHMVSSMHLYDRNIEAAKEAVGHWGLTDLVSASYDPKAYKCFHELHLALELERAIRTGSYATWPPGFFSQIIGDSLWCCSAQFNGVNTKVIQCPVLRQGLETYLERKEQCKSNTS